MRFHDPRHTAATIALAHGNNMKAVSEMLGHSSVVITGVRTCDAEYAAGHRVNDGCGVWVIASMPPALAQALAK
jgi:integrase